MYAQMKSRLSLPPDRTAPSSGRLLLLALGFIAAAVTAYSLTPLLPAARYSLTPAVPLSLPTAVQALVDSIPDIVVAYILRICSILRGTVPELLLWGLAAVIPTGPVLPLLLAMWRGGCFGAVLAMITTNGACQAVLTGVSLLSLMVPLLVTTVLFIFAAVPPDISEQTSPIRGLPGRFLVTSGGVFVLVLIGALLPPLN